MCQNSEGHPSAAGGSEVKSLFFGRRGRHRKLSGTTGPAPVPQQYHFGGALVTHGQCVVKRRVAVVPHRGPAPVGRQDGGNHAVPLVPDSRVQRRPVRLGGDVGRDATRQQERDGVQVVPDHGLGHPVRVHQLRSHRHPMAPRVHGHVQRPAARHRVPRVDARARVQQHVHKRRAAVGRPHGRVQRRLAVIASHVHVHAAGQQRADHLPMAHRRGHYQRRFRAAVLVQRVQQGRLGVRQQDFQDVHIACNKSPRSC